LPSAAFGGLIQTAFGGSAGCRDQGAVQVVLLVEEPNAERARVSKLPNRFGYSGAVRELERFESFEHASARPGTHCCRCMRPPCRGLLESRSAFGANEVSATSSAMISITVPVYNEEQNIPLLYERVTPALGAIGVPWELVFVNDGSTDGSAAALDRLAEADSRVKVLHFRRNFGQTAAMMAGFDYAIGDVIVPIDGDLQNDPADIPKLLEKLDEGYDVCSGWRKDRQDARVRRNLPSRIANRLISAISGVHLHDYGCTLKAYRSDVIKGVKLYGEMHRFVPIYASWQGARVTEIPITHHPRQFGKSKYGLERTVKVILDLIVVKFLAKYAQKPMYVFGTVGLVSLATAMLAAIWAAYLKFVDGLSLILTPLPLVFVLTVITGIMCILMGLLAELLTRTYHESQDKAVYVVGSTRNVAEPPAASARLA
jgi:glycosyltransferase involved in cell wall biosynthesis